MKFLDRMERKFGKFAIKNLMTYIISANAIFYVLIYMLGNTKLWNLMILIPERVMQGEIWRLITFILIPPNTSVLWIVFTLYFYYLAGSGLESHWGSFKFNIYYLCGILGTIIGCFISGGISVGATFINLSLFLAFAKLYPDFELLVFLVLPVPIRILALIDWFYIIYNIVVAPNNDVRLAAVFAVVNYFLFFGKDMVKTVKLKKTVAANRDFRVITNTEKPYIHKCTVCGITENDDPDMEFRYCSKCSGAREYCMKHIKDHEHI
ncbi:MAG: rhomboid family intramembrane serine protease [Clostridium sp.]|uniref:rhomboid family intramembrane serine protease n=1 Tax=Clostridium sp. TaxID=1506 RepID=UPI002A89D6D9|nr:rhomboid family intramembrane serine protease [Clostridium sp.]MDY5099045.1 rhomboid family intramembrane serine protease [Clostridium sp.]